MKTYNFKVVVEPDGERWHAYCPALVGQGGATWGYTQQEALKNDRLERQREAELDADGSFDGADIYER